MRLNSLILIILIPFLLIWIGCSDDEVVASNPDNERPAVEITEPVNGALIQSPKLVTIKATATDNIRVSRVDFYIDGTLFISDNASPYEALWNINKLAFTQSFTLTAAAVDPSNNRGTSAEVIVYATN